MTAQVRQEKPAGDAHLETSRLNIRRVLLPTDFSESSERARQWAVGLARWFGSKLYLLNAVAPVLYVGETGIDGTIAQEASMEAAKAQVASMASSQEMHGLEHEEIVTAAPVADAIRQAVSAHGIDLVVMGSHGAGGLKKLALGSVTESALRYNPAPVMVIGPKCEGAPRHFESIVFATDLEVGCLRPAQYAAAMAEENNARITLLHVLPKSEAANETVEDEVKRQLETLLPRDAGLWSRPSLRVEHGNADEQVLNVARGEKADLIVMGTRDGGPLSDHAPWSTLSRVIRGAACPVLAVRAHTE